MPQCQFCDHHNPAMARTCEKCGAEISASLEAAQRTSDDSVADLLMRGEKIEAIKRYRERTGASLKEATEAVEALGHARTRVGPSIVDPEFEQQLIATLERGNKIEAIKQYRERTQTGLKEAKDAVEALARRHGIVPAGSGCSGAILFAAAAGWMVAKLLT